MIIHSYAKLHESLSVFDPAIDLIKKEEDELFITNENKRSFRELEKIKKVDNDIIYVVSSLTSLGLNHTDISNQLSWFIENSVKLVICDIPSTFEFGVVQPMNQAILSTILQSILNGNENIVTASFKRTNSGRNKLPFPENWDELYEQWTKGKISSKKFIDLSGLKKATFYNLVTEYKEIQSANEQYLKRYKKV